MPSEGRSGSGCTQDLSSRGALLWTGLPLKEGALVEMVLVMPSEITLAEDMNLCCHARVTRLEHREQSKPAVAVKIERYEFLHSDVSVMQHAALRELQPVRP